VGAQDLCVEGACVCQPACDGKVCGDDGCDGECGTCEGAQDLCVEGACVCQPACDGKACGDDGCDGVCGTCVGAQDLCVEGACVCQPACDGKACGDDGCNGECGACAAGKVCIQGACLGTYVLVDPGPFSMGTPPAELCRDADENQHAVTLTQPFLIKTTEVTQAEWVKTMGGGFDQFGFPNCGPKCPAEMIDWFEAVTYCNKLSAAEGLEPCYVISGKEVAWPKGILCKGYRLPTEAEWELAARAGTETPFYAGQNKTCGVEEDPVLKTISWYAWNALVKWAGCYDLSGIGGPACAGAHPVGLKAPNPKGLYDMSGNVWEWTWDWYSATYDVLAAVDPTGPAVGTDRAMRGGAWTMKASSHRSGNRGYGKPEEAHHALGLRPVRTLCEPKCQSKQCGDDGCGGNCGTCAADKFCTEAGKCQAKAAFGQACGTMVPCTDGLLCLTAVGGGSGYCTADCTANGTCPAYKNSQGVPIPATCTQVLPGTKLCAFFCGLPGQLCPDGLKCQQIPGFPASACFP
jgi:formylglycine-generating enzyme required for sulfatase activity